MLKLARTDKHINISVWDKSCSEISVHVYVADINFQSKSLEKSAFEMGTDNILQASCSLSTEAGENKPHFEQQVWSLHSQAVLVCIKLHLRPLQSSHAWVVPRTSQEKLLSSKTAWPRNKSVSFFTVWWCLDNLERLPSSTTTLPCTRGLIP